MAVVTNKHVESAGRSLIARLLYPKDAEGIPSAPVMLAFSVALVAAVALGLYRWYMKLLPF